MGRHSGGHAGRITAAVIAGVILVAGGGAWAAGSILGDDGDGTSQGDTTASSTTPTASSTASDSTTASPSAPASASPSADEAAAERARASCTAQVRAAEAVATAVAGSATHWKQHTDAYLAKTSGRITLEQTKKIYADSKAFGLADEKAVAATTKAFTATGAACGDAAKVVPADAGVTACTARLKALDAVRTTGTKVQNEWSAHMRMMANKAHTDGGQYHQTWLKAVSDAQKSIPAHAKAAAAVAQAPACA
ncbi:hypothetical protein [Knoellia subterranea]|uniref:Uncharacterized protein n=1 Tax=Knoellia subterranea KCTC 19937 TaxID=1385521 RepID=A0A0A0JKV7_9MICO|nr:hypothetical protein [Knoellia subterranea]KGN36286.1 hypothetical protein N803_05155 [Knoellia subterranea KCTC 19937]